MTDDNKTKQLENRIDTLESKIEKMMPSRRDALKMGGAALVGGAAMTGTASAGTNQVGTIGSQASPVDLESEDINNADTVTTQDLVVNGTTTGISGGLPADFTYNDIASQRSLNTTFTNNTGSALLVICITSLESSTGDVFFGFEVDGTSVEQQRLRLSGASLDTSSFFTHSAFVPNGSTYRVEFVTATHKIQNWFEVEM